VPSSNPALVSRDGARRLPRLALLLLCAAYVLPGIVGREPWRDADLVAFAQMLAMAEGRSAWWPPALSGLAGAEAVAPWAPLALGAAFIELLSPWVEPALAARLPFALLLVAVLAWTWYASFHLARTDKAQPLPFAFGGEAEPVDYARAIADGALLAVIASLGLLQLGHETTPELMQLAAVALYLYALAAAPFRRWRARLAAWVSLPVLAASGAPAVALTLALAGAVVCRFSALERARAFAPWLLGAGALACALAWPMGAFAWRAVPWSSGDAWSIARQWLWFLWPCWPFMLWTLARWRAHWRHRHISVPAVLVATALITNLLMAGSDRALMLAIPGAAVLAAFALPTFRRSTSAAIDWFTLFFFSAWALAIWTIWLSVHTGWPAKPAANLARLVPGFEPSWSAPALCVALAGTAAWAAVVRWRTGRHRQALWKSMVLPASGTALCWLLLMTLGLPALDYARNMKTWAQRVETHLPAQGCIAAPGASDVTLAALTVYQQRPVLADSQALARCQALLVVARIGPLPKAPAGWGMAAEVRRPANREELTGIYLRQP
jgi:hypothetical protein